MRHQTNFFVPFPVNVCMQARMHEAIISLPTGFLYIANRILAPFPINVCMHARMHETILISFRHNSIQHQFQFLIIHASKIYIPGSHI